MKTLIALIAVASFAHGATYYLQPDGKVTTAPPQPSYATVVARVEAGESFFLAVGQDSPGSTRCDDAKGMIYDDGTAITNGLYWCELRAGKPTMRRVDVPTPMATTPVVVPQMQLYSPLQSCPNGKCPTPSRR